MLSSARELSVATETYQIQLERVQTAIAAIEEGGQDVVVNGRRMTRADLDVLYKREGRLRKLATRASGGTVRQVVPR